jgi:hypothetical protein
MPFRRMGRPGLIGTAARTAVVVGTVSAVTGRVARRQAAAMAPSPEPLPQPIPVQQPGSASAAAGDDLVSQIERLGQLAAAGVLTPEEFATAKARLLAEDT